MVKELKLGKYRIGFGCGTKLTSKEAVVAHRCSRKIRCFGWQQLEADAAHKYLEGGLNRMEIFVRRKNLSSAMRYFKENKIPVKEYSGAPLGLVKIRLQEDAI